MARVIEEVFARVPMDAVQGHMAAQIVITQFLADDFMTPLRAPGLDAAQRHWLIRTADALLHTVARLERLLERRQFRAMPFREVRAVDGYDLDALAACRTEPVCGRISRSGARNNRYVFI